MQRALNGTKSIPSIKKSHGSSISTKQSTVRDTITALRSVRLTILQDDRDFSMCFHGFTSTKKVLRVLLRTFSSKLSFLAALNILFRHVVFYIKAFFSALFLVYYSGNQLSRICFSRNRIDIIACFRTCI